MKSSNYKNEIDGLRGIAILPVLFFHAGFSQFEGGYIGVDVFFVISGYLITKILLNSNFRSIKQYFSFLERRVRRLVPALLTVIVFSTLISYLSMYPDQLISFAKSAISSIFFLSNYFFFFDTGYFSSSSDLKPLLHTWSLANEFQYYITLPIVILCFKKMRMIILIFMLFFLISILLAQFGGNFKVIYPFIEKNIFFFNTPDWGFYFFPTRAWEILSGCFCYMIERKKKIQNDFLSFLSLFTIIISFFIFKKTTPSPSFYLLIPIISTMLVILCTRKNSVTYKILTNDLLCFVGLISYSLYLWHQPLLAFSRIYLLDNKFLHLIIFPMIFVVSFLSWKLIETPFRSNKINSYQLGKFLFFFVSIIVLLNLTFILNKGFIDEYSSNDKKILKLNNKNEGEFVSKIFNSFIGNKFGDKGKKKIMIIGDSMAQDFTNLIYYSGISSNLQFSTHRVGASCGNLFINTEKFKKNVDQSKYIKCSRQYWSDSKEILEIIKTSDYLILSSLWTNWEIDLLPISLDNIMSFYSGKIIIVGNKSFGEINKRKLLNMKFGDRINLTHNLNAEKIQKNNKLKENKTLFFDYYDILCKKNKCSKFTDEGFLISYDGQHLTKEGVSFILKNEKCKKFFEIFKNKN
tara:strand:- start:3899 stop:5797 length:1899 start_codon:yes stop_codon:yes gene_type:complete